MVPVLEGLSGPRKQRSFRTHAPARTSAATQDEARANAVPPGDFLPIEGYEGIRVWGQEDGPDIAAYLSANSSSAPCHRRAGSSSGSCTPDDVERLALGSHSHDSFTELGLVAPGPLNFRHACTLKRIRTRACVRACRPVRPQACPWGCAACAG